MNPDTLQNIYDSGVVSVIRGLPRQKLRPTAQALLDGGVTCVEIALNTPDALEMIADLKRDFSGSLTVGAGTVLELSAAREAIRAGADFLLAPIFDPRLVECCAEAGKLAVPGCFTASEVLVAHRCGAGLVKIFPAGVVGPTYIKDLLAPLPFLKLMPMGGVNLQNAAAFIKAGAFALGVGACLVDPAAVAEDRYGDVTAAARALCACVNR